MLFAPVGNLPMLILEKLLAFDGETTCYPSRCPSRTSFSLITLQSSWVVGGGSPLLHKAFKKKWPSHGDSRRLRSPSMYLRYGCTDLIFEYCSDWWGPNVTRHTGPFGSLFKEFCHRNLRVFGCKNALCGGGNQSRSSASLSLAIRRTLSFVVISYLGTW